MDSTRPIRALARGLDALVALNAARGATVAEIAQQIRLPRTTAYRILETLARAGYIVRDDDDRYRVTLRVRGLSSGFDDEAWITDIARPELIALCEAVAWPVAIFAPAGTAMVVRASTDDRSPFALERRLPGTSLPMLTSASGLAYLAFSESPLREQVIDLVNRTAKSAPSSARDALDHALRETRDRGFASAVWPKRVADLFALAVPILSDKRVIGTLSIRFLSSALPLEAGVERFVPKLRDTVSRIQAAFGAAQAAA